MAGSYWNKNSMLHQTLGSPFLQFHHHVSAAAAAAPAKVEPASDGVEAAALKKARRHEAALPPPPEQGGFLGCEMEWAVERGGALLGDDFSVDDLLDFEGLDSEFYDEEEDDSKSFAFAFQAEKEKSNSNTGVPAAPAAAPPLAEINLPAHDAAEFEWMTSIMEDDTVPAYPVLPVAPYRPASGRAPAAPAPASSLCRLSTEDLVPVKAKRSRRPRTMGNPWLIADSSTSSSTTTTTTSSTSSAESSYLVFHHPPLRAHPQSLKKRGRKPKPSPAAATAAAAAGERRCTHCGSQKTPQWRAGPSGPKTLCNACGVRFKSGRLVPEYRPAASPTFVSHVHSNSHRKVLEMRRKKEERALAAITSF